MQIEHTEPTRRAIFEIHPAEFQSLQAEAYRQGVTVEELIVRELERKHLNKIVPFDRSLTALPMHHDDAPTFRA